MSGASPSSAKVVKVCPVNFWFVKVRSNVWPSDPDPVKSCRLTGHANVVVGTAQHPGECALRQGSRVVLFLYLRRRQALQFGVLQPVQQGRRLPVFQVAETPAHAE